MSKILGKENRGILCSVFGASAAVLLCLILILGMAKMLLQGIIGQGSAETIISGILLLSSIIGNLLSFKLSQKDKLPASIITTVIIFGAMVIGGLTIDGKFESVLIRLVTVIVGWIISCFLCIKRSSNVKRTKMHYR